MDLVSVTRWVSNSSGPGNKRCQTGSISILVTGFAALAIALSIGIAIAGRVAADRAVAAALADGLALASLTAPDTVTGLAGRVPQASVAVDSGSALVTIGSARAQSFARQVESMPKRPPAFVAIVARAKQLTDSELEPTQWNPDSVVFVGISADIFATVAAEFGLCADGYSNGETRFARC